MVNHLPGRGHRFSPEELEILKAGRAAGKPYKTIAAEMGHTRRDYRLRDVASRMGWVDKQEPPLYPDEIEEIRVGVLSGEPLAWIAKRLDRSQSAVNRRARLLGLKSIYLPGQRPPKARIAS